MSASNPTASARLAISRNAVHGTGLPSPSAPAPIGSDMPSFIGLFEVIAVILSGGSGHRRNAPGLAEQPERDREVEQVPEDAVDERPLIRPGQVEQRPRHPPAERHTDD